MSRQPNDQDDPLDVESSYAHCVKWRCTHPVPQSQKVSNYM